MFGYIRPHAAEMRVKEYAYYRAVYCGVCKSMAQTVSPLLSATLRYDFVLLVMVRMVLDGTVGTLKSTRCLVNPWRKKTVLADCDALRDTAHAAALLTHYGVLDNIADEHGIKRLAYRLLSVPSAAMRKKVLKRDPALLPLDEVIRTRLAELAALETAGEPSPDAAAEPFGALLGAIFAHGYEGNTKRIAETVGHAVGRCIYLLDAIDDAPKDEKKGAYNPFVLQAKEIDTTVSAENDPDAHRSRIETAMLLTCRSAYNAMVLADGCEDHPAWPCIANLLLLGIPHMTKKVLDHPGQALSGKDPAFSHEPQNS